jgi:hypothetical protein
MTKMLSTREANIMWYQLNMDLCISVLQDALDFKDELYMYG